MPQEKVWKPLELVKVSAEYLAGKSVPGPRLDAEVLLCEVLGLKRRVDLYAGFEREVSGKDLARYRELVRRRAEREPVSRILGRREFMGIEFAVTPDVLSPRPETELLVEAVLECACPKKNALPPDGEPPPPPPPENSDGDGGAMAQALEQLLDSYAEDIDDENDIDAAPKETASAPRRNAAPPPAEARPRAAAAAPKRPGAKTDGGDARVSVLDLGTGSGCVAVSLAAHLPAARVVAVDASPKAIAVAKKNASGANVAGRVEFRQGDWFAACREGEVFDFIVSNPPYLVEGDPEIWPEVSRHDPPLALYGGRDGLDCYRRIVPDAPLRLAPEGWLLLEVGAGQGGRVGEMLARRGFRDVAVVSDYGGMERVVKGKAPPA